ncbi:MAG: hypothetical protein ACPGJS_15135 [Flammeovirgaceae bacterium]
MINRILFFALISLSTLGHQVVFANSGNKNTPPSISTKLVFSDSDSTLGMGNCSNGLYIIGQSFDQSNPKFPYKILVQITYVTESGATTYGSLSKEGSTLEELYDQIDYESGFANFTINLGNCSSKPQTVYITSIFRTPNDGIELVTNASTLATIPEHKKKIKSK